jgi:hypothetical protein
MLPGLDGRPSLGLRRRRHRKAAPEPVGNGRVEQGGVVHEQALAKCDRVNGDDSVEPIW